MTAHPVFAETQPPDDAHHGAVARQAIVDSQGSIFGYEIFDRSGHAGRHTASSDAQTLFALLANADHELLTERRTVFINCTHESLASGHLDLIAPANVVLEMLPLANDCAAEIEARGQTLQDIRARGFRLAFNHTIVTPAYRPWLPMASFIKFDLDMVSEALLPKFCAFVRAMSQAELVAEKIETRAQHQLVAQHGVKLFQGYWFARPVLVAGQTVRSSQVAIIQLINLVRQQASTTEIEEVLKRDPTLSFNLLRFINSSGFGLNREVTSFRHAVMLLGLKKLFRWAALLMTTSRASDVPPAVASMAVVRGRLMELLAAELLPAEDCDNAFVVGVFSMLDTMLGMPMDQALSSISLPAPVLEALLLGTGELGLFLRLTIACEHADDVVFSQTATQLNLSNAQVNWAHLQALSWAESLSG